jgi:hypothetical protein
VDGEPGHGQQQHRDRLYAGEDGRAIDDQIASANQTAMQGQQDS